MSAIAVLIAAAGVWLLASAFGRAHPDPIREALRGHPLDLRRSDLVDLLVERWDSAVGARQRRESVAVLCLSDRQLRAIRVPVVGLAAAAAVGLLILGGPGTWPLALLSVPAALVLTDRFLAWRAARQRQLLAAQVVVLAEYLALGTTAGLTPADAIDRSAPHLPAPLRTFVTDVVAELRAGSPLRRTMETSAGRLSVAGYSRLCDTILTAAEQGSAMAPTLLAQVKDFRDGERSRRMERAGRAEVAMLVPIVLLVLPAVVAVAVFPGVAVLSQM